jgi:hypothetical protein
MFAHVITVQAGTEGFGNLIDLAERGRCTAGSQLLRGRV